MKFCTYLMDVWVQKVYQLSGFGGEKFYEEFSLGNCTCAICGGKQGTVPYRRLRKSNGSTVRERGQQGFDL